MTGEIRGTIVIMQDNSDAHAEPVKYAVMPLAILEALLGSHELAGYLRNMQEPDEPTSLVDLTGSDFSFSDDAGSWLEELERIRLMAATHLYETGTGPDKR